ncbi:MAG: antibiotic biosynthesis monooxygenase [Pseudomonadota bacterium]
MIVYCVTVHVKPESVDAFIEASIINHDGTRAEPGNIRFDVLQNAGDPATFFLYEAYESREAAAAHKDTAHYLAWRDTVAPMMAGPREGIMHGVIRPEAREQW